MYIVIPIDFFIMIFVIILFIIPTYYFYLSLLLWLLFRWSEGSWCSGGCNNLRVLHHPTIPQVGACQHKPFCQFSFIINSYTVSSKRKYMYTLATLPSTQNPRQLSERQMHPNFPSGPPHCILSVYSLLAVMAEFLRLLNILPCFPGEEH